MSTHSLHDDIRACLDQRGEDGASVDELLHDLQQRGVDADRASLRRALRELTRSGDAVRLDRDLYGAPGTSPGLVGRLRFLGTRYVVEVGQERIVVDEAQLGEAIAGDIVNVVVSDQAGKGPSRGVVTRIVEAAPRNVFAISRRVGRFYILQSPRIDEPMLLMDERARAGGMEVRIAGRAASRRRVRTGLPLAPLIALMDAPARPDRAEPSAKPARRGKTEQPATDAPEKISASDAYRYVRRGELNVQALLDQLAHGMGVDGEFPPEAVAQSVGLEAPTLREDDIDLTDEPLVTIDGETAMDYDDAVCARRRGREVEVLVAIADVSHYVPADSALDVEARRRGCSVYLPARVYPMLPERLSNGLCSLVPGELRRCAWVRMRIDEQGDVTWYDLGFGVMRSRARLTYTSVQAHLDGREPVADETVAASLGDLFEAYQRLLRKRQRRGMLDLDLPESVVALTEDGTGVRAIITSPRWDSHRLIEECMLATNETVADFLSSRDLPCIYRSHDEPNPDKLEQARRFVAALAGVSLPPDRGVRPIDELMELIRAVEGHPAERVANYSVLRAMQKAAYSVSTHGHFGIGATRYAHFTSPIRRYADLEVHRMLRMALEDRTAEPMTLRRATMRLEESARASNEGELRANSSERFAQRLLKARYMLDHVGEEYDVIVTGVQRFGAFVAVPEGDIEGLVHVSDLGSEFMQYHEATETLRGRSSRRVIAMGDRLRVRCQRVVLHEGRIDFVVVEAPVEVDAPEAVDGAPPVDAAASVDPD